MEICILKGILFSMDKPTELLLEKGFRPVCEMQEIQEMQGKNIIIVDPARRTLHVVLPYRGSVEVFDFTNPETTWCKSKDFCVSPQSLFRVTD